MIVTILVILLILWLVGGFPGGAWFGGNGAPWGNYGYGGGIGLIVLILIILLVAGRL